MYGGHWIVHLGWRSNLIVPLLKCTRPKGVLDGGCVEWRDMFGSLIHESEKQHNKIAALRLGSTRPGFWYLFHDLEAV